MSVRFFRFVTMPPRIVALCFGVNPAAVVRFVIAIDIDSVDCALHEWSIRIVPTRHCPVEERFKIVSPFFAHRNSSAAVVFEALHIFVVTPVFNVAPHAVKSVVSMIVRSQRLDCAFFSQATAAGR
jgi:hypothetical protein